MLATGYSAADIPEPASVVEALVLKASTPMEVRHAAAAQSQFEQRQTTATLFSEQARAFLLAAKMKLDDHKRLEATQPKPKKAPKKKAEKEDEVFYPKLTDVEISDIARNLGDAVKLDTDLKKIVCPG